MTAQNPVDLTRLDELMCLLSGASRADRDYIAGKLAAEVPVLVAEVRTLRAERGRGTLTAADRQAAAQHIRAYIRLCGHRIDDKHPIHALVAKLTESGDQQ